MSKRHLDRQIDGKGQKAQQAVALRYEPERYRAPRLVAKGRGKIAKKIIDLARKQGIPIHEDPDLVAALSALDWYEEIPEALYQVVAEVLAFAYRLNNKLKEG
ncbi:MAG: flagellar biosynthesis protein FlhB [Deltaproteobacteria bacterium]|nr:MAG: flagellar biosynthesis protein FlhB [Deltaproteobacteria bacterium]